MLALSSITASGRLILDIDTGFCIVAALMIYSYIVQEYEYLPFYCNSKVLSSEAWCKGRAVRSHLVNEERMSPVGDFPSWGHCFLFL